MRLRKMETNEGVKDGRRRIDDSNGSNSQHRQIHSVRLMDDAAFVGFKRRRSGLSPGCFRLATASLLLIGFQYGLVSEAEG